MNSINRGFLFGIRACRGRYALNKKCKFAGHDLTKSISNIEIEKEFY